ncbi:hypothetical protein, partial [Mitsuokella jalaludinii]|uniref:hypothetical protein n=1 Tax=Mitsuokella jalaludinii TaxID=187979 RepID=UPI00307BC48F
VISICFSIFISSINRYSKVNIRVSMDFSLAVYYNRSKISTDFCPKEKTRQSLRAAGQRNNSLIRGTENNSTSKGGK